MHDLPRYYLITPEPRGRAGFPVFLGQLERCLKAGVRLVLLRAKTLYPEDYAALAYLMLARCRAHDAQLIVYGTHLATCAVDTDGLHLDSRTLMMSHARPAPDDRLLSVACHSLEQLNQAARLGADLVTLSPVRATSTHAGAVPLGWPKFAALAQGAALRVYALGGMYAHDLMRAQAHGAYGIAAISGLWRLSVAPAPAKTL